MSKIKLGGFGLKTKARELLGFRDYRVWPDLPYESVGLIYWVPPSGGVNFGDELSRVVVTAMMLRRGITPLDQTRANATMLAIGSILHCASQGATIWGSGANVHDGHERKYQFNTLDVRAVRGPRTAEFLRNRGIVVPSVFGDPALLLHELFPDRFRATGEVEVGFVPNHQDMAVVGDIRHPVIDPRRGWNLCVEDILRCRFVAASSLHGLIIAEAWGIPARYVRLSGGEGLFKYRDYYEGTGRPDFTPARSVVEAIKMGGEPPPVFDSEALKNAFPYDLWKS